MRCGQGTRSRELSVSRGTRRGRLQRGAFGRAVTLAARRRLLVLLRGARPLLQPQVEPAAQHDDGGDVQQRPEDLHRHAGVVAEVQRLRDEQGGEVPRQFRRGRDLGRARVHQHGLVEARRERFAAAQEEGVVVRAGKRRAREGDERQAHARGALQCRIQRLLQRAAFGLRGDGLACIGRQQRRELVVLPVLDDQIGPGIDHAGAAHHEGPHQGDDAQQVVQVQPFHAGGALLAHRAEIQLAHEGRVEHHARDDGHEQQQPHEAQEELARQPREQVHMQLVHDVHEALVEPRLREDGAGAAVHGHRAEVGGRSGRVRERDEPHVGVVRVLRRELHDAVRMLRACHLQHPVQADPARFPGHRRRLDLRAQQVADLVVEDQRQPRQAEQEHEHGAHQAAPLVQPGPGLEGFGGHIVVLLQRKAASQKSTLALSVKVRGAPTTR